MRKWRFFFLPLSYTTEKDWNKILFLSLSHIAIIMFAITSTWKSFQTFSFMSHATFFWLIYYFSDNIKLIQTCSQKPLSSQEEFNLKMTGSCSVLSDPLTILLKLTVRSYIILDKQIQTTWRCKFVRFIPRTFIENIEMLEREDLILLFVGSN